MSSAPTLHIEAFDWSNSKPRYYVLGEIDDAIRIFLKVQQDHLFRGRKVLVLMGQDSLKPHGKMKLFQQPWDLVLRIRGNMDYSILGAYLQNIPKPISILWIGGEIPSVLLNKYDTGVHWICHSGNLPVSHDMNFTFISPSLPPFKYKDWLTTRVSQAQGVLASIEDLRSKKAGMVVCSADHSIKWYDAAGLEGGSEDLTIKDLREVLVWCTEQLGYLEA